MAADRVIQCLFERKPRFHNSEVIPPRKARQSRKQMYEAFAKNNFKVSSSMIENNYKHQVYMRRRKSKYKQLKDDKLLSSEYKTTCLPLILNSTGNLKVASHYSTPEIHISEAIDVKKPRSLCTLPFKTCFIVNYCCCDGNQRIGTQPEIYRCQPAAKQICCCNCNSDAMFEVMKSLYDCYKNKNCNNCKCVLCGPKFRVETLSRGVGVGEGRFEDDYAGLEDKTPSQKERIFRRMAEKGIPLPRGRTPTEEAIIQKVQRSVGTMTPRMPEEKLRKARAAGLLTPLEGKTVREKENILRGLADAGMPLPIGKTASEKRLIAKVRKDMGLPREGKTKSDKHKIAKAYAEGIITPLEGKTTAQKEVALRRMAEAGIPLPEGRTSSEKDLIERVKKTTKRKPSELLIPSAKIRKAKAEGLLTPLEGKSHQDKERILRGLGKAGIPLPEAKTYSEQKLIDKVKRDLGLPPEPQTASEKRKLAKAYAAGIITPLEGKTKSHKEQVLRKMAEAGVPLPEGRTPSERDLIEKVKKTTRRIPSELQVPSEKIRRAKMEGLLTPLENKTKDEKETILTGLARAGIPLPAARTHSDKIIIDKIRRNLGLPPEPQTESEKRAMAKAYAAGIVTPLEGKTTEQKEQALRRMAEAGIRLPEGRTASEKAIIKNIKAKIPRVPSSKLRKVRAEGLLTPLEGKTTTEKEKILKALAKAGIPLPDGKTSSERKMIKKIRKDLGLPPDPKTSAEKERLSRAFAEGIITPLDGKSPAEKEQILRKMAAAGVTLPEGRTPSEQALIDKVERSAGMMIVKIPSEKIRKAQAAGLLTPLEGKTAQDKEKILRGLAKAGMPMPEPKTSLEKRLIDKVRKDMGLPPKPKTKSEKNRMAKAYADGIITPLEGKSKSQKEAALRRMAEAGVPLPEGRTPSEKDLIEKIKRTTHRAPSEVRIPSAKMRKAKIEGLLTPLEGKTREEKEKILKGLAKAGIPLPEARTYSEQKLMDKVRRDMGLPPEPQTQSQKRKMAKSYAAGIITPLEGKTTLQKEQALKRMAKAGIQLPEGRTPSEVELIDKIKKTTHEEPSKIEVPSEKLRRAKIEGLLTPLEGKTHKEKEKILRGLAKAGVPLPPARTNSEKKLMDIIRKDMGLPPEPQTESEKRKIAQAYAAGIITPLEGKTTEQKEQALRRMAEAGIRLPEGRTASEKAIIKNIKAKIPRIPSDKLRKVQAEGLITPLEGKTQSERENILKRMAKAGVPLPEGKTSSERKLIKQVRRDMGLPPEPKTPSEKVRLSRAYAAGIITPLEGKTEPEKEQILRRMAAEGVPLPEGRTASERALIAKVLKRKRDITGLTPSEKIRAAKAEGLLTPLEGKSSEQKEKIFKELARRGLPLPEGKTTSEKRILRKVIRDMGLPSEPESPSEKVRLDKAYAEGIVMPLEGKSRAEKEKVLRKMAEAGIPMPEGRTASERALIDKVLATTVRIPSEKLRKAKAEGLLTPLEDKTQHEKEQILKRLAKIGIPLPTGKTRSEKDLIQKVRRDLGLPPEPSTSSEQRRMNKAYAAGIITPLEGKTTSQKEKALRKMAEAGVTLPIGRTDSEKKLIKKIEETTRRVPSAKLRKAKAEGWLTPLEGKSPEQKEQILRGLAKAGVPLPEGQTQSEKDLVRKVRRDLGLPTEPRTFSEQEKLAKGYAKGLITPLEGKTTSQKEKVLRKMAEEGVPLPVGRTESERALIKKVKETTAKISSEKLRRAKAEGLLSPLEGKSPEKKEQILRGLAKAGIPLPEAKTLSENILLDKVRKDMGLPPEPVSQSDKERLRRAYAAGIITPLEGKSHAEKEKILRRMADAGISLPQARTASEKDLREQIMIEHGRKSSLPRILSEKLQKARAAGLLTPLEGKSDKQREKILRKIAKAGLPLPIGQTSSERRVIDKVRRDLGLPPEPKTSSERHILAKQYATGTITPLKGKSKKEKERILRKMAQAGVPLPEPRTPSEKKLIEEIKKRPVITRIALPVEKRKKLDDKTAKVIKESTGPADECICDLLTPESQKVLKIPSGKLKAAKAEGLLTPLKGKSHEEKERILKGLADRGLPLPEAKTSSEKKLIEKVKRDYGLPPEPVTSYEKLKLDKAYAEGIITPLEGKSRKEKERILRKMAEVGVPLPEGRTASERQLIDKIKKTTAPAVPSDKIRAAKSAGLLTPLRGKSPAEREKILRGLAQHGLPLPEGKTSSERKLIQKVKKDMGLPPEPKTSTEKHKLNKAYAAGIVTPLEGKSHADKEKALRRMAEAGIPLPEGRTYSERKLIDKIKQTTVPTMPSDKIRAAKSAGLLTPLQDKSTAQREKILRGLAQHGLPLPEGKTSSERKLIQKVRKEMGLPSEPTTSTERRKLNKAYAAGIITPLDGKTHEEKEKVLKRMAEAGVPLPEGRTASERQLIDKIKKTIAPAVPSDKIRAAKSAGLLTPLRDKSPAEREKILRGLAQHGLPLPEGKTSSERKLIQKVRKDMGLPPEPTTSTEKYKLNKAYAAGIVTPLEGKSHADKEKALRRMAEAGIPLPEGRTSSERKLIDKIKQTTVPTVPSEKIRAAKRAGLLTPLRDKSPAEKEKILRGLAEHGIPLPEAKTSSERKLIQKVRKDMGLPPEPVTSIERQKFNKAYAAGIITPLEGKTHAEKEKVLKRMAVAGIPLPEGRTASERDLINKIKKTTAPAVPSDKIRAAKAAGLLTPLSGKTSEEKEKVLRGLAKHGLPLPEGKTPSERKIIQKVRRDMGLPSEPATSTERQKLNKAYAAGIITPLEGKTHAEKEKALKRMAEAGVPLPEGRTASERQLIDKIKKTTAPAVPSDKIRAAKSAGLLTPLRGKSPAEREKILRGLAQHGLPLPEGKTSSERKLIQKVRKDMGLPPEPITSMEKERLNRAYAAGIITPLEGKTDKEKEKVLRQMAEAGIPLPEGRTPSEKEIIHKIKKIIAVAPPSEKIRAAKAAGLLTPLEGKTTAEKENILRGLAKGGLPLPEGKTSSERKLIQKVRKEMGLPSEPKTSTEKRKLNKAYAAGIITPLEGKSYTEKEKALRRMAEAGVPLPEGRTASERELIEKIKKTTAAALPSDKIRAARAAGLLTPLEGKPTAEKEKILRGLAKAGIPLPEGRTSSERKMINKIRKQLGLPPEPKTLSEKNKMDNAYAAGIITPLDGKSAEQKERALRRMAEAGVALPEGRTLSERELIAKVKSDFREKHVKTPSEKIQTAKIKGFMTPLEGKTDKEKERILRGLANEGLPLPKGRTLSEKMLIDKVIKDLGLPPKPKTSLELRKYEKAYADGLITPLEGKTTEEKEKRLRKMADAGIELPKGRTSSEKALIDKIRKEITRSVSRGVSVSKEKVRAGITEEVEEVVRTKTCERACGCDRKKIRFKHSYIKIRVTSPDISSFCSCPDECIPGIKGGVFVDNEGIKVTVGRAIGTPSYTPSSGSIMTQLSFPSIEFSKRSTSSAATISDCDVNNATDISDVFSDAIFDIYVSSSSINVCPSYELGPDGHCNEIKDNVYDITSTSNLSGNGSIESNEMLKDIKISERCSMISDNKSSEHPANIIDSQSNENNELLSYGNSAETYGKSSNEFLRKLLNNLYYSESYGNIFNGIGSDGNLSDIYSHEMYNKLSNDNDSLNGKLSSLSTEQKFDSHTYTLSQGDITGYQAESENTTTLVHSQGDLTEYSKRTNIKKPDTKFQSSKSVTELMPARSFVTNSSSYDSVIILLTDSSSSSYIEELGTVSVISFESNSIISSSLQYNFPKYKTTSCKDDVFEPKVLTRLIDYRKIVTLGSKHIKRTVDFTTASKRRNGCPYNQHYCVNEGIYKLKTTHCMRYNNNYWNFNDSRNRKETKTQELMRTVKKIFSQRKIFTSDSSICVLLSSDTELLSDNSCANQASRMEGTKSPKCGLDSSGCHLLFAPKKDLNETKISPTRNQPERYKNNHRIDHTTEQRGTNYKQKIQTKENPSSEKVGPNYYELNCKSHNKHNGISTRPEDIKLKRTCNHAKGKPQGVHIIKNEKSLKLKNEGINIAKKAKGNPEESVNTTIRKLKRMIYADDVESCTSASSLAVEGMGIRNQPYFCQQLQKNCKDQVPDPLRCVVMQENSSDFDDEFGMFHFCGRRQFGKTNLPQCLEYIAQKHQNQGCQIKLCRNCSPRHMSDEGTNIPPNSNDRYNYHILADSGMQCGSINSSCNCSREVSLNVPDIKMPNLDDYDIILIDIKEDKGTCCGNRCEGIITEPDKQFVEKYGQSQGVPASTQATAGAQTTTQPPQPSQPSQPTPLPKPCLCTTPRQKMKKKVKCGCYPTPALPVNTSKQQETQTETRGNQKPADTQTWPTSQKLTPTKCEPSCRGLPGKLDEQTQIPNPYGHKPCPKRDTCPNRKLMYAPTKCYTPAHRPCDCPPPEPVTKRNACISPNCPSKKYIKAEPKSTCCACPTQTEDECSADDSDIVYTYDDLEGWIDKKEIARLKSDLARIKTGFKFQMKPKMVEVDMSVEEAIEYYRKLAEAEVEAARAAETPCVCDEIQQSTLMAHVETICLRNRNGYETDEKQGEIRCKRNKSIVTYKLPSSSDSSVIDIMDYGSGSVTSSTRLPASHAGSSRLPACAGDYGTTPSSCCCNALNSTSYDPMSRTSSLYLAYN